MARVVAMRVGLSFAKPSALSTVLGFRRWSRRQSNLHLAATC